jgi:hypothetical protein
MKLEFNADDVEVVDEDFSPLPSGEYPVIVEESEFRDTKAGDGHYLFLQLSIIDGHGKNRKLFDRLNLDNPNPQAVEISKKQLASLCRSVGKQKISDSGELHDIPVIARVEIRKGSNGYDDSNDIKGYKKYHAPTASMDGSDKDDLPF